MSNICPKCGALSEENQNLCSACGEVLNLMYYIYVNNLPTLYRHIYE